MEVSETSFNLNENQPFDSADPPYGTKNYDLEALEPEQEEIVNEKNTSQRRENEQYLQDHPEVHGLISILLRHLLIKKPGTPGETQRTVIEFFERPRRAIIAELLNYLLDAGHDKTFIVYCLEKELDEGSETKSLETATTTAERSTSQLLNDCT